MTVSLELTAIVTMGVAGVFWLSSLSFMAKRNEKDIERLWKEHEKGFEALWKEQKNLSDEIRKGLTDVGKAIHALGNSLYRIEGRLEMNDDKIKD